VGCHDGAGHLPVKPRASERADVTDPPQSASSDCADTLVRTLKSWQLRVNQISQALGSDASARRTFSVVSTPRRDYEIETH
jgi:hypothetical protein